MKIDDREYQIRCPNIIDIVKEKADFYTDSRGNNRIRITGKEVTGQRVCGSTNFEVLEKGVFDPGSGFDPLGFRLQCKDCGNEYYAFPRLRKVKVAKILAGGEA